MKLYSKSQVLIRSLITAVITAAVVVVVVCVETPNRSEVNAVSDSTNQTQNTNTTSDNSNRQHCPKSRFKQTLRFSVVNNDAGQYTQDEAQNISVYEKCNEAVVNITTQTMGYDWFLEPVITSSGSGGGSIIDKRGYVVTNVHVIENASKISISLADGTSL